MLRSCAALIIATSFALAACGIKGPLKLPPGKSASPPVPATTPEAPDVIDATKAR